MTLLERVVEEAGTGATVPSIAGRLGIPTELAELAVDELVRLGRLERPRTGCTTCPPPDAELPVMCAGCPLAARARRR